eukprot:scaffold240899_cov23-Tisochrysis_lutea.AAC.1
MAMDAEAALRAATAVFLEYDCGQKGHLKRHEVRAAHIALFGWNISSFELDALLPKSTSERPVVGIELPDFCSAMVGRLLALDHDDVIRRQFRALDTHCNGFIRLSDLRDAVNEVAPHLPHATISLIFSQIDSDRDGRVSYSDFYRMITGPVPSSAAVTRADAILHRRSEPTGSFKGFNSRTCGA